MCLVVGRQHLFYSVAVVIIILSTIVRLGRNVVRRSWTSGSFKSLRNGPVTARIESSGVGGVGSKIVFGLAIATA